ncbi:MAG: hypothetical protein AB8B61_03015 [Cyclobacteriaceae bacterium]
MTAIPASKKKGLENLPKGWFNIGEFMKEKHFYDSLEVEPISFLDKITVRFDQDSLQTPESIGLKVASYTQEEAKNAFTQIIAILEKSDKMKGKQKALSDLMNLMEKNKTSWNGKKLSLENEPQDLSENKEITPEKLEMATSLIQTMFGGSITIEYTMVFDKKIKKFSSTDDTYQQIDKKMIGYKVDAFDILSRKQKTKLKVITK